ncbi:hypothetical protein [Actinoplanes sp. M2I2]|uniref:hypothetical protein n=1 Tax=Actinoplanes sp. M2I2 TaxID=1734444 RepID=UPI002021598A|nr:hypothetical protein [Actinoplanes sp. M2I2]
MSDQENSAGAKQGALAGSDAHPERAQGRPTVTPEATARPTHGGAAGDQPARSLPDEPLKPQD